MDDFTFRIGQAIKEEDNQKRNKAIASALRCILEKEYKERKGLNKLIHLEQNLKKWQKDPDSFAKVSHTSFRIYEIIKILEEC